MRSDSVPTLPNRAAVWDLSQAPTDSWPLISHLELRAIPASVPSARKHARAVTLEWELSALVDDVELVVSELVTNAVNAALKRLHVASATSDPVRLWIGSDMESILIQVWDSSPEMPVRRQPGPSDERGRGLILAEHICRVWGTYRKGHGKVVWLVL
jgi:anti-sigma regulatory factor (Ser/Thr protein kinase)